MHQHIRLMLNPSRKCSPLLRISNWDEQSLHRCMAIFQFGIGRKVKEVKLTSLSQKYPKYKAQKGFFKVFSGKKIIDIERHGKFLVLRFDQEKVILNHLGMSGKWLLTDNLKKNSATHPKAEIIMDEPPHAIFDDVRNFGQFRLFESYEEVVKYRPINRDFPPNWRTASGFDIGIEVSVSTD